MLKVLTLIDGSDNATLYATFNLAGAALGGGCSGGNGSGSGNESAWGLFVGDRYYQFPSLFLRLSFSFLFQLYYTKLSSSTQLDY